MMNSYRTRGTILGAMVISLITVTSASAATFDVSIGAGLGAFSPSPVNINAGDTVRWTNNDSVTRNVSSNSHPSHTLHSVFPNTDPGKNIAAGGTFELTFSDEGTYGYHDHGYPSRLGTVEVAAAVASSGGGGYVPPSMTLIKPNGGEVVNSGSDFFIFWSAEGTDLKGIRLSLSTNDGTSYDTELSANEFHDGIYTWRIPNIESTKTARIRLEMLGTGGAVIASDDSDAVFEIIGMAPPETEPVTEPTARDSAMIAEDPTITGTYDPAVASSSTPTIDIDRGTADSPVADPPCVAGSLIRASLPTVYYCASDGKRYVFPNERIYFSWYEDFSLVTLVSDDELAAVSLGGNVNYRPGLRLVKITTDPKVYAVSRNGLLRWVQTEAIAIALYGNDWNTKVDDLNDAFFFQYSFGDPITEDDLP